MNKHNEDMSELSRALSEAETHLTIPFEPSVALHWVREAKRMYTQQSEDIQMLKSQIKARDKQIDYLGQALSDPRPTDNY